jgi:hypothetical protein
MIDTKDFTAYSFKYSDFEGKIYNASFENPGPTWMEALDDYVRFLESIYKYDIRSKVRIEEPAYQKLVEEDWGYIDPWTGEYFTKEDDTNQKDLLSDEEQEELWSDEE